MEQGGGWRGRGPVWGGAGRRVRGGAGEALPTKPRGSWACLPGGRGPDIYLPPPLRTAQGNGTKSELLARTLRGGSPGPGGERGCRTSVGTMQPREGQGCC